MDYRLYIVGTPIGNFEDITLRALRILKESDIILCEDTKTSIKLLKHYEINNKHLIAYHNFNEKQISKKVINYIFEGKKVSLISDAGMPCISDPGFDLIKEARKNNIFIDIIGGVSALMHAFIKSNLGSSFSFLGFLKNKSGERINELSKLSQGVYVSYVSPHKLINTLNDFDVVFGDNISLYLCKELTKLNEKEWIGTPREILSLLANNDIRGEYVLVFLIKKQKHLKINKYENKKNKT